MSDETETMGEVARVLDLHASFKASAEIQDPNTPWYWECDGCDARLALSGTYGRPEVVAALANHQAAMLAEAGLLRDGEHLAWERGYTWGINDEQNGTTTPNPYPAQIAASVPAGQPAAGSAGRGGSGGLDGAPAGSLGSQLRFASLVAASTEGTRWIQELSREADRLENERDAWRTQGERWMHAMERYGAHRDELIERVSMLRELAGAIRANSHCSHLATDIETLLDTPVDELRALDETNEEGA